MGLVPFGFSETKEFHYPLFYTNAMPAIAEWQSYGTQLASQWLCSSKYFKIDKLLRVFENWDMELKGIYRDWEEMV